MLKPKKPSATDPRTKYLGFNFIKRLDGVFKEIEGEKRFYRFHDTYQEIYKASPKFDVSKLDNIVPQVLSDKKVTGVLVVFEVTFDETDETTMVSNFINKEVMEIIQERNETVFEYVGKRLQKGDTKYRTLKFIYLRIIYKKPRK